jgi:ABC-2 type transport system permease protein
MMLFYKAWLETRTRFLVSLLAITGICSYSVWLRNPLGDRLSPVTWRNFVLHQAHTQLTILWLLAVSLLMMGGLLQEYAVGASDFTLALPVSRTRLTMVRIWMGYAQAIALIVVPWTVMFLIDLSVLKVNSINNAWFHVVILVAGGTVFVAWALLISSLIAGSYTAPAVALGGVVIGGMLLGDPAFNHWSPYGLLSGQAYLNRQTNVLDGPIPWLRLAITIAVAAVLTWAAIKAIQRKEF